MKLINEEGRAIWQAEPDDWGAVRNEKTFFQSDIRQPIRFQGQWLDEESGFYYNRYRFYDPRQGRYVTQDPIGLKGEMNLYAYVGSCPGKKPGQWTVKEKVVFCGRDEQSRRHYDDIDDMARRSRQSMRTLRYFYCLMVYLRQPIGRIFLLFSLIFSLATPAFAENMSASIALVEAVSKSESSVHYRIMYLSADGKRRELLASLQEPVYLVQCGDEVVTYLDRKGNVWDLALQNETPVLLAKTTFSAEEDVAGKFLFHREEKRFYAVIHFNPGSLKESDDRFQVKEFYFDGRERVIASENGRAYAIRDIFPNMIDVVNSNGLLRIDKFSMNTRHIIPFDSRDLPYLAFVRYGNSVFLRDDGQIKIKRGLFEETALRYKVDPNFGRVQDFNGEKDALLIVVVDPESGDSRLVEMLGTGVEREIYRGVAIGSACYMLGE